MTSRFHSFADVQSRLDRLLASGATTSGSWTPGQIVFHLAAAFEASSRDGGPMDESRIRRERIVKLPTRVAVLSGRIPDGVPIPAVLETELTPPPDADPAIEAERLRRAIAAFEAKTGAFPAHPVLGPLTRDEWHRFHLSHCALHFKHFVEDDSRTGDATDM